MVGVCVSSGEDGWSLIPFSAANEHDKVKAKKCGEQMVNDFVKD